MPRPQCWRRVVGKPASAIFKPAGIPACELKETVLTLDEFEAIRLADMDGLYQEKAARKMKISRSTFGRTLEVAHQKIAAVLANGEMLRIEGGPSCGHPRRGKAICPRCKFLKLCPRKDKPK
jgi:uncharacterized protein